MASLCASVRRLAPFEPEVVLCLTGPVGDRDPQEARAIVVEGLREVARTAREVGVRVALEPIHASARDDFTMVDTIPDAVDLVEEVGLPMGVIFDTWHLWDTPDVLDHVRTQAHRFPAVHVNDWRDPTRGWDDRALPGEGVMDLPAIFGALEAGGFDGWYEMETSRPRRIPTRCSSSTPPSSCAVARRASCRPGRHAAVAPACVRLLRARRLAAYRSTNAGRSTRPAQAVSSPVAVPRARKRLASRAMHVSCTTPCPMPRATTTRAFGIVRSMPATLRSGSCGSAPPTSTSTGTFERTRVPASAGTTPRGTWAQTAAKLFASAIRVGPR